MEVMGLLPVSSIYIALSLVLTILLSINVVRNRVRYKIDMLHGDNVEMLKALRAHGNNIEYVPFALIGLAAMELMAAPATMLHICGGVLVVGRLFHAQGLYHSTGTSMGRMVGTMATWLVILFIAGYLLYAAFT